MDFAAIGVERVTWKGFAKNKSKCSYGSGAVRFQMPRGVVKMIPSVRFPDAYDVQCRPHAFPDAFRDFYNALLDSARESLAEDVAHKNAYDPWGRLTVFDDALLFDAQGAIVKNVPPGYHDVSVLVQLDGAWMSDMSWGLRFRVVQLKVHAEHVEPYVEPAVRILVNGQSPPKKFLFLADD
jgi:hypothetical protein